MRQKLEHPKIQLRRGIFRALIPPVIDSIGSNAATENDTKVDKNGDVIDEKVTQGDHWMQHPFENDNTIKTRKNQTCIIPSNEPQPRRNHLQKFYRR